MEIPLNSEQYFEELSSLIATYSNHYRTKVVANIYGKGLFSNEPNRYIYTIIHKSVSSLEAMNFFIRNFDSHPHYHTSLNLIIRTIMSDFIITEYINICTKTEEDHIKKINELYSEHLDNVVKFYKHLKEIEPNEKSKWDDEIESLMAQFPEYFDVKTKKTLGKANNVSFSVMSFAKEILITQKINPTHLKAFDLYALYSKLEHLGILSFDLTHRSYKTENQEKLRTQLYDSLRIIVAFLNNYSTYWSDAEIDFEYLKNVEMKILEMHPSKIK